MGRAVVVLAQGRTGSSVVAGILHHLGVYMGDPLTLHYEDGEFYRMHQAMIGDWKDPHLVAEPYLDEYRELIARRQAHDLWGVKDPRLCFIFPVLIRFLRGTDVRMIFVTRAFRNIVESLAHFEGGRSQAEARQIALNYAQALEQAKRVIPTRWPTLTVAFDTLVDNPEQYATRIARFVGMPVTDEAINLIDPSKRHWAEIPRSRRGDQ